MPHSVGQAKAGAKDAEANDDVKSIDKHLAAALCFKCGRAASLHALPPRDSIMASMARWSPVSFKSLKQTL
jgi:hypothetical protein